MAERAYSVDYDGVNHKVIKWTGLLNGDTGQWYPHAGRYPDKTMHVFGTAGAGLHVKPFGSNESGTPSNRAQLRDATEDLIDITTIPDAVVVLPNTRQIQPDVAGDGTTAITVLLELKA